MKPGLCEKFEGALTEFEMTDTVNLRRRVDIFWIENRVQSALTMCTFDGLIHHNSLQLRWASAF